MKVCCGSAVGAAWLDVGSRSCQKFEIQKVWTLVVQLNAVRFFDFGIPDFRGSVFLSAGLAIFC
jgi:hypothetical protein